MRITRILQNSQVEFVFNQVSLILAAIALLLILLGLQMKEVKVYISKAKTAEGLNLITTVKQDVSAFFMETGRWPDAYIEDDFGGYGTVESISFDGSGGIHILYNELSGLASGKKLSIVAATSKYTETGNLLWICGLAKPPESYELNSIPQTNLPDSIVTPACRNIKL